MSIRTRFAGSVVRAALLGTAALAGPVHAQTVTLYGVISTGIQYVSNANGGRQFALANGGMMPPRFGFRGDEDLGGGNHAIFTLENGFSIANGALLGGMFGRQAFVGLRNDRYGTLTAGRQYEEMTSSLWWAMSANVFSGIGAHIGDNDNMFFTNRFNNSVRYQSPTLNGLTFASSFAFANSTAFSNNDGFSLSANYARGPLKLGVAATQFNRRSNATPANLTAGAVDSTGWGFSSPFVLSQSGAGTDQQRIFGAGAGYDFGVINVTADYTNVLFNYSDTTGLRLQNAELSAYTRITPSWLIGATYIFTYGEYSGGDKPRWHQVDVGTLYSFSKRTDGFVTAVYQRAAGDARYAQIYSLAASSGKSQTMIQIGLRHRF
ncbi:porin [Chitinasiproducens palmae]|uniref:Outer membrane protein (Porin) n=1 Tax=Chitinasiproducens palmae TaxID=1770053 RepID=A0A1H2PU00_9BURK|nr:porin [Chitinasiproducens palmae]SDV50612.1 Outer membrane protein (porin) [Chitinasiproducens palmae]